MKQTISAIIFLFFCSTFVPSNASADFKADVEAAAKKFTAAIASKDAATIGSLYAQDAIAFPPNSETVKGKDAIQAFWKSFIDSGATGTIEPVETESDGNLGIEVGKYTISDPSGKHVDQGKYVVVWKKEKGSWKMYRDIWNTSMPPTPAPPK